MQLFTVQLCINLLDPCMNPKHSPGKIGEEREQANQGYLIEWTSSIFWSSVIVIGSTHYLETSHIKTLEISKQQNEKCFALDVGPVEMR